MATVLVVDDEPLMLTMVTQVLQQDGFAVLPAGCGSQAISIFHSHRSDIDLLVSDIRMPEMDGPALAARLKAEAPELPVLLMSGYCEPEQAWNGCEFLAKPFSVADLLSRVRSLSHAAHARVA
jgi:CheY-like chemotaxis protein